MKKRKPRNVTQRKPRNVTQKLGAKPKTYRRDPDRHIIALARAMEVVWGCSQTAAFDQAVSWFCGDEAEHEKDQASKGRSKPPHMQSYKGRWRRQPSGTVAIGWCTRPGAGASCLWSMSDNLVVKSKEWAGGGRRGKDRRLSAEDDLHLQTLIGACLIALSLPNGQAIHHLLDILGSIGEREFGEKPLAPLALQKSSPNNYSPVFEAATRGISIREVDREQKEMPRCPI